MLAETIIIHRVPGDLTLAYIAWLPGPAFRPTFDVLAGRGPDEPR